MRESFLERKLINAVKRIGGKAFKWVSPGTIGVPDRIVVLPHGRVVFVEMKAPGKPLQPMQCKWAEYLTGLEHKVYKIDSLAGVEEFIVEVSRNVV